MSEEPATTTSISPTRSGVERCSDGISKFYCGLVALFALYVMWLAMDAHYTFPHHDDWRILDNFFSIPLLEFLVGSQLGHRVPFTLFLLHLDYTHLGGHMNLLVLGSVVCTSIGVIVLARTYWIADQARTPLLRAGCGFACFLFCWAASRHDLVWGLNQCTLMAAMWTFLSMASLSAVGQKTQQGETTPWKLVFAAAGCASAATFSQGIGFACWIGLLATSAFVRLPIRALVVLGLGAWLTLQAYTYGLFPEQINSAESKYLTKLLSSFGRLLEFAVTFIGAPATALQERTADSAQNAMALATGAVGLASYFTLTSYVMIRRRSLSTTQTFAFGLSAVAFAAGWLVALNRLGYPNFPAIPIRYSTFATMFWMGLGLSLTSTFGIVSSRAQAKWSSLLAIAGVVVLSLFLVPDLRTSHRQQDAIRSKHRYISAMHILGLRWNHLTNDTWKPDPERTQRIIRHLRRDKRNLFSNADHFLAGSVVGENFVLANDERCKGEITWTNLKAAQRIPLKRLSGWAVDIEQNKPLDWILVTDADFIVRGLGVSAPHGTELAGTPLPDIDFPWTGFLRLSIGRLPFQAFGVLDDALVCNLNIPTMRDRIDQIKK